MPADYLMAIDCGSGGVKCFLVDAEGKIVSQAGVEWDRDDWNTDIGWRAIKKAIRKTLTGSKIDPSEVAGISTTSMREEFVLLDKRGQGDTLRFTPDIYATRGRAEQAPRREDVPRLRPLARLRVDSRRETGVAQGQSTPRSSTGRTYSS